MSGPGKVRQPNRSRFWYEHYEIINGLDCRHCSQNQRQDCREHDLYHQCPKLIKLESLNKPILDSEGNITKLGELVADDKALDFPLVYASAKQGWATTELGKKTDNMQVIFQTIIKKCSAAAVQP
jgi:hypothetical protein